MCIRDRLGRVITADAFVPVGGVVDIEGAGGKVQYTIVQAGILQYQLVCIRLGEGFRTDGVGHEPVSYTHLDVYKRQSLS